MPSKAVELIVMDWLNKRAHRRGGTGDVLFLGSILLLIGCVHAGLILLEVADESSMNTDGAGDGSHDVLGERSGLVSEDDGGVCHRLTGIENTDKREAF